MNKIKDCFNKGSVFIAYITAGQGGLKLTKEAAIALVDGGVDILEIGVPFSDPVADGSVIQRAMNEALSLNVTISSVLDIIKQIKKVVDVPIVLFTYLNPLLKMGLNNVCVRAKSAGVDGILVVDLPLEESEEYYKSCAAVGIEPVCIIAPSTPIERIRRINQHCNSFLYYVCRNGTTGIKNDLPDNYAEKINRIKAVSSNPVVAGFGISSKHLAALALSQADGFVVGSLFVKAIEAGATPEKLKKLAIKVNPKHEVIL